VIEMVSDTNFKETEIGLIPEDWEMKRLSEIATFSYGKFIPKKDLFGVGCPVFSGYAIVGYLPTYEFEEPQLIIVCRGVGGTGDIKLSPPKCTITNLSIIFKLKNKVDKEFLYWNLKNSNTYSLRTGSAQPQITINDLNLYPISLPNLKEQKRISYILKCFQNKIELNQRMNQTLEEIGRAIFKHWFVDFEFPDERGRPYKSSGGEMVDSELGEVPKGWEVKEIGKVIETIGGGTPSTKKEEYWENGDLQWFSPRDITANGQAFIFESEKQINELGLKKSSANLFPAYSVMMTSRATVGELSINTKEACTNQGFITCIPNDKLSTYYIYFWIERNKENIISLASGSTFKEINKSTFRSLKVIVPSKNIMLKYNYLLNPIFGQIKDLQGQNNNLSQIRDSLLPKLMSGKIRIKKQEGDVIGACRSSSASENP
jgi:type I restriction enzyme S subunit